MQVSQMSVIVKQERGAALVTVLLFMTLTFILITSMLSVTGNEVVISSLQRDSVRAMDLAQSGLQEAIRRMEEGRRFVPGFTSSLQASVPGSSVAVTVTRRFVGVNSAYQEIRADATIGRSTRRLSTLVLQRAITFPPNITFAASVIEQGSADISCGDAYARTFIQYKSYPSNSCSEPDTISYSGWRMSKASPDAVAQCYTNAGCIAANPLNTEVTRWYPSTRRTEAINTTLGADIAAQKDKCPAGGGGSLPADTIVGTLADGTAYNGPAYGFDVDDPDGVGPPLLPQAVIPGILPCGLPYKLVAFTFPDEIGNDVTRIIKSINFEQWFALYWRWDESKLTVVKRNGSPCSDAYCLPGGIEPNLASFPQLGAVPPFPEIDTINGNFDCRLMGGGVINTLPVACADPPSTNSDLGCKSPQMSCSPAADRPVITVFEAGDYTINGTIQGHGTIVINGNLTVNGDFEYWGTIIVNGTLTLGAGSATIHGGLVADSTLRISGNINVEGGGTITNIPTGRSIVTGRGWWER
jgi:hypothetical protein